MSNLIIFLFNHFPVFIVGFICNGFSIKLIKIAEEVDPATSLTSGATHEGHMRSTCRKLKSQ